MSKGSTCRVLAAVILLSCAGIAQKREYDFYPPFRNDFTPRLRAENPSQKLDNEAILTMYAASLKRDGVSEAEISRRIQLLRSDHPALEADYWNRFYLNSNSKFNKAPNAFLAETV